MNWMVPLGMDALRNLALATFAAAPLAWALRRNAAVQLRLWRSLLLLCLTMPALSALMPAWSIPVSAPTAPATASTRSIPVAPSASAWQDRAAPATARAPERHRDGSPMLGWIWMLAAGGLATDLIAGAVGVQRLRRRARPLALCSQVPVLESSALGVPAAIGIWRPTIVLPSSWREWDEVQLAAVLAHEAAHVARNDVVTLLLARVHRAMFWFSPLGWWLPCKLGSLMEAASDEASLQATGIEPQRYAELLLAVARSEAERRQRRMPVAAMASNRSAKAVEARVRQILNFSKEESMSKKIGWGLGTAGVLASLALVAAAIRPASVRSTGAQGYQYVLVVHPKSVPGAEQSACPFTSYDGWTYIAIGDGCAPEPGPSEFAVRVSQGAVVFSERGSERQFKGKPADEAARLFRDLDVNNAQQRYLSLQQSQLRSELAWGGAQAQARQQLAEQRENPLMEQVALIQERIKANSAPGTPEAEQRLEQLQVQKTRLEALLSDVSARFASNGDAAADQAAQRSRAQDLQHQLDGLKLQASGEVRQLERSLRALAASLGAQ